MDSAQDKGQRTRFFLMAFCLVLFAWLCVPFLGQSLYTDEVLAVRTATAPIRTLLSRCAFSDPNPPLYFIILKGWIALGGTSELWLRGLSLLCALLALFILFDLAWRLEGLFVAMFSSSIVGLSVLVSHFAVEVRPHALTMLLTMALLAVYVRWLGKAGSRPLALLLFLLQSMLVLTSYFGLAVAAGVNLHFFLCRSGERLAMQRWNVIEAASIAVASWWLPMMLVQIQDLPQPPDMSDYDSLSPLALLNAFGPSPLHPVAFWGLLGSLLFLLAAVTGAAKSFFSHKDSLRVVKDGASMHITLKGFVGLVALMILALCLPFLQLWIPAPDSSTREMVYRMFPKTQLITSAFFFFGIGQSAVSQRLRFCLTLPVVPLVFLVGLALMPPCLLLQGTHALTLLLVLFPLGAYLASVGVKPVHRHTTVGLFVLLLMLSAPSLVPTKGSYLERPDLRAAAEWISNDTAQAQGVANFILPMWDRPGIEYYLGAATVNGISGIGDVPAVRYLPGKVNLILTRAAQPNRMYYSALLENSLAGNFALAESKSFRKLHILSFQRSTKAGGNEDTGNKPLK